MRGKHESMVVERIHRLCMARLYVIVDAQGPLQRWQQRLKSLIDAGVDVLQLRDKSLDDGNLLERARCLRQLTNGTSTLFIMNDRADLAALAQADGVHVGQDELSPQDVRTIVGANSLVGVSTHGMNQVRQAIADGAHYIGVGPIFPSGTKRFDTFPGLDFLREVARQIGLPAFAIGGIDSRNLSLVLSTGSRRIAVSGAIRDAEDPLAVVRKMGRRTSAFLR